MINLLPSEAKENFFYARRNARLLRWVVGIAAGLIGVMIITGVGTVVLNRTTADYERNNSSASTLLKTQNVSAAQAKVQEYTEGVDSHSPGDLGPARAEGDARSHDDIGEITNTAIFTNNLVLFGFAIRVGIVPFH